MKFEKGDIVCWMGADKAFGIVIGDCEYFKGCYRLYVNGSYETHSSCSHKNLRYATHDEKELLITALAKENKYYCEETKTIKEMKKEFTKKDLKSGMWVERRDGIKMLYIGECRTDIYGTQGCFIRKGNFTTLDGYSNSLTNNKNHEFDIVKVFDGIIDGYTYNGDILTSIWQRPTEPTKKEKIQAEIDKMQNAIDEMQKELNDLK